MPNMGVPELCRIGALEQAQPCTTVSAPSRNRAWLDIIVYISGLQKYPDMISLELQTKSQMLVGKPLARFSSYPRILSLKAIKLCEESAAA
jgi:hypothetical protein